MRVKDNGNWEKLCAQEFQMPSALSVSLAEVRMRTAIDKAIKLRQFIGLVHKSKLLQRLLNHLQRQE